MGPKCNHECPYKREAKGGLTTETEGNVMTEKKDAMLLASNVEERATSQRMQGLQLSELQKARK